MPFRSRVRACRSVPRECLRSCAVTVRPSTRFAASSISRDTYRCVKEFPNRVSKRWPRISLPSPKPSSLSRARRSGIRTMCSARPLPARRISTRSSSARHCSGRTAKASQTRQPVANRKRDRNRLRSGIPPKSRIRFSGLTTRISGAPRCEPLKPSKAPFKTYAVCQGLLRFNTPPVRPFIMSSARLSDSTSLGLCARARSPPGSRSVRPPRTPGGRPPE